DELAQERNREPAREAWRAAVADRIVLDALRRELAAPLQIIKHGLRQLRGRELPLLLRRVEGRRALARPEAGPVRHVVRGQPLTAVRARLQRLVELARSRMLETERRA